MVLEETLSTVHKLRSEKEYERSCLAKILKIAALDLHSYLCAHHSWGHAKKKNICSHDEECTTNAYMGGICCLVAQP